MSVLDVALGIRKGTAEENRKLAFDLMERLEALNFSTNHFGSEGEWEVVGYSLHTPTTHRTGSVVVKLGALKALVEFAEKLNKAVEDHENVSRLIEDPLYGAEAFED